MKKLITIDEHFTNLKEGCLVIPLVSMETLEANGIPINEGTDVELRTRGKDPVKKQAVFRWVPSETDACMA